MWTISDFQLLKQRYDLVTLERNVGKLDKKILLATQMLSAEFCIKYIWDPEIDSGSEDSYIYDFDYILGFQPHLTRDALYKLAEHRIV
tara:strand:- start:127 stop:390 length:264 start_codon:yes stop_codon:yes gene_type:complete